ncbi:MAG: hypothetical protein EZS28_041703 [Streblomastix strix]|uniref:Uncharacterized protein n=1 Tax=Streblomastix strix TaxID=222440 RepID=A0A5J4TXH3_9EUKA|nr:MAG: hypothetical protein EZS28_041703 [Streblomastix strix]
MPSFTKAHISIKIVYGSLISLVFLSLLNCFFYFDDRNGWVALVGIYALQQESQSVFFFYVVVAGFSFLMDIVRLIVAAHGDWTFSFFAVLTAIGLVLKLVSVVSGIIGRDKIEKSAETTSASRDPYLSAA